MRRIIAIFAIIVLSCAASFASEPLPTFEKYVCDGNHFCALVPSKWTRSDRNPPYADMTRVAGATFEGAPASIAFYWYSGERNFTTAASYITTRLGSMVRVDAEKGWATADVQVAGRKATGFKMKTFELVTLPHDRMKTAKDDGPIVYESVPPSRKVVMDEQYVVLTAAKGLFVLHYRAPEMITEIYRLIFDKVTESFEPTRAVICEDDLFVPNDRWKIFKGAC